jgi:hypothetical protein
MGGGDGGPGPLGDGQSAGSSSGGSADASMTGSGSSSGGNPADDAGGESGASTTGGDDGGPESGSAGGCGYRGSGVPLHVAAGIDVCLAPVVCTSETCPPGLGQCVGGKCVFQAGYQGLATLPQAWATYYCDLTNAGCHGVGQVDFPEVTAQKVASAMHLPLCTTAAGGTTCVGIAAAPPMVVGNSQQAIDPATGGYVKDWGLGMTEPAGLCYRLTGPGGTAIVALTDRCGGFCQCGGSGYQECGACVSAPDMHPECPCVGTAPGLYTTCCGRTCGGAASSCDWCASNNHPHFDLDVATFNFLCASQANLGSCQLSGVSYLPCLPPTAWPPP